MSTAPTPKLGATSTWPGVASSQPRTVAYFASSKPLVPTTAAIPASSKNRTLSSTPPGWVKSTTTCAPASTSPDRGSPRSSRATSSRSSAPSTARHTSPPMRPFAPSTPTLTRVTRGSLGQYDGADPDGRREHAGEKLDGDAPTDRAERPAGGGPR